MFKIKSKELKARVLEHLNLVIVMFIIISFCIVMSTMTSPILTDSIYDKIAIEMYYKG